LKWAGGKGQLLERLFAKVPKSYDRYFEPFLGGGALFFALRPKRGVLSDVNREIIDCYTAVRDDVGGLVRALREHRYESKHYYAVRDADPRTMPLAERAARTIFLNKTGFNGLYRVNRAGKFNVPFGRYAKPAICDEKNLRACSAALADVELIAGDFEKTAAHASPGDFVYFDPPYVPLSRTAAFTAYAAGGFDLDAQSRLAGLFSKLAARGVEVLLSNSDVPEIRALYAPFAIETIHATRVINSKATRRGPITELLVHLQEQGSAVAARATAKVLTKKRAAAEKKDPSAPEGKKRSYATRAAGSAKKRHTSKRGSASRD
jgi:DNA adenine methylase